ncbi:hypothetical protein G4D82_14065 [Flavobacterium sp. CYK-4]|uniref:hypothetical protein n=1 Tax=Flavobacterium lotistagni TaxID=2709660 RepID=UPI0014081573|nr:hypothetical protein [Flavobacterium lotistagni]NHM08350.1 hypothetical protein [Flavobacterium lotistagni]
MKKKIPLQVLETIEPFVNKNGKSFEAINPNDFLLKFIDKDDKSDFYFNVEQYKMDQGFLLLVDLKPKSRQTTENRRTWIKAEALEAVFGSWIELLEGYAKVKTVFDDPILEAFAEEYYTEFEIIDEEADVKPFSVKQILMLDSHLENIQKKIEKYKTEENAVEIEQIKIDTIELRNNLSKKSKKWVIKQLSKVWAQIAKQGPTLIKEFLSETKKLVVKEGIKFILEKGVEIIN